MSRRDVLLRRLERLRAGQPAGLELNRAAWEASFKERGLPTPPTGPRDGYWGVRINPKDTECGFLGTCETQRHIPGLWEVDARGWQHAGSRSDPEFRILIVGGSVAMGAYASSVRETYFEKLARLLERSGFKVGLAVAAIGGEQSASDLAAFALASGEVRPHIVVFLNGLNDLIAWAENQKKGYESLCTTHYLRNMAVAAVLARAKRVRLVACLQPFLGGKTLKSPLEQAILDAALPDYERKLLPQLGRMREGLESIAHEHRAVFVDCSGALDGESVATFADQWHFSDAGHTLLAACLNQGIEPMLRETRTSRYAPPSP